MRGPSFNKITRPALPKIVIRKRLFRLLEDGRRHPLTWVTGPPGSGKTTLVASYLDARKLPCVWYQLDAGDADLATFFYYLGLAVKKATPRKKQTLPLLTPEYQLGIPAFTRRFFAAVSARLRPPAVVVFDNYHSFPFSSPFHETLLQGLDNVARGIRIIFISRSDPPPAFARMQANNLMDLLGWEQLRLTSEETAAVLKLHGAVRPQKEAMLRIHEKTEGWVAGIVLAEIAGKKGGDRDEPFARDPGALSAYFAGEVFSKLDGEMQDILLKTAYLPRMTPRMAETIAGNSRAGQVLAELNRRNFFTERRSAPEVTYQYHSLFRDFLLAQGAQDIAPAVRAETRTAAAGLLETSGQIEDAAELRSGSRDWRGLLRLVLQNAPALIAQGRNETIERWIAALPAALCSAEPWLLYWRGTCCLARNPAEARPYFVRAYDLCKQRRDRTGLLLCWCGVVDTFIHEWDSVVPLRPWIVELRSVMRQHKAFPSPEIELAVAVRMFNALLYVRPQDRDLPRWQRTIEASMELSSDPDRRLGLAAYLMLAHSWTGALDKMHALMRDSNARHLQRNVSPATRIFWTCLASVYYWFRSEIAESLRMVREALELAKEFDYHVMDIRVMVQGVYASLAAGEAGAARDYLERMASLLNPRQRAEVGQYHYASAYYFAACGELGRALEHAGQAVARMDETGAPFAIAISRVCMAQVLVLRREHGKASHHLSIARRIAEQMQSFNLLLQVHLLQAQIAHAGGDEQRMMRALRRGLALGREKGIISVFLWLPAVTASLCEHALLHGIETEYVRELIRRHDLVPDTPPMHLEAWPWPIRISTLGKFEVLKDDRPLVVSRKAQKRPLQLLKALVAFGGRDVSEERLAGALWPDAEGDAARKALGVTVVRLRKLLGMTGAVIMKEGSVSLDPRSCRVDTWAFERAWESAGRSEERQSKTEIAMLEKAIDLYRGPFLAEDPEPWNVSLREKLRDKYLRSVSALGAHLERSRNFNEAVRVYQRGLDADDLIETYYQRLMSCYRRLGRRAEALAVYNRCRKVLAAYALEPSQETEDLRSSMLRKE